MQNLNVIFSVAFKTGISISPVSFQLFEIVYQLKPDCFGTKEASQLELEEINKVFFMKKKTTTKPKKPKTTKKPPTQFSLSKDTATQSTLHFPKKLQAFGFLAKHRYKTQSNCEYLL